MFEYPDPMRSPRDASPAAVLTRVSETAPAAGIPHAAGSQDAAALSRLSRPTDAGAQRVTADAGVGARRHARVRRADACPVTSPSVSGRTRLHDFELEPEVRDWLDSLSDSDFKRVDEVCGLLAEKGAELGGPWSDHLDGAVWELRIRLRDVAARITYWCTADGRIVLLTVFRKTRQHDQRQIDRAVRAQKPANATTRDRPRGTYERQV